MERTITLPFNNGQVAIMVSYTSGGGGSDDYGLLLDDALQRAGKAALGSAIPLLNRLVDIHEGQETKPSSLDLQVSGEITVGAITARVNVAVALLAIRTEEDCPCHRSAEEYLNNTVVRDTLAYFVDRATELPRRDTPGLDDLPHFLSSLLAGPNGPFPGAEVVEADGTTLQRLLHRLR